VNLGDSFVNRQAPGVPSHLWLVLSDPNVSSRVVLVNVSSDDGGYAGLTSVAPGEHAFVTHGSYIRWDKARVEDVTKVRKAIADGLTISQPKLSEALLTKAQKACLVSSLVPNEAKAILTAQGVAL
jgi:hypothetical protein